MTEKGGTLYLLTNRDAPNRRLVTVDAANPVFDPELSGVEREKQVWRRVMALVLAVAGGVILAVALRRR